MGFRDHWLWGVFDIKSKDILNNETSKESEKMFVATQGLGMSIKIWQNERIKYFLKHY